MMVGNKNKMVLMGSLYLGEQGKLVLCDREDKLSIDLDDTLIRSQFFGLKVQITIEPLSLEGG